MTEWLDRMEETLADARAELTTDIGGHREMATARVWRGDVLVDWERDEAAGGCLLRPDLVRRLVALNASLAERSDEVSITAGARIVAALSRRHAGLAAEIGPTAVLRLRLRFDGPHGHYLGGDETYELTTRRSPSANRPGVILRLSARVHPATARPESPRTSPEPS